jgi:hypothetical protein
VSIKGIPLLTERASGFDPVVIEVGEYWITRPSRRQADITSACRSRVTVWRRKPEVLDALRSEGQRAEVGSVSGPEFHATSR